MRAVVSGWAPDANLNEVSASNTIRQLKAENLDAAVSFIKSAQALGIPDEIIIKEVRERFTTARTWQDAVKSALANPSDGRAAIPVRKSKPITSAVLNLDGFSAAADEKTIANIRKMREHATDGKGV